LHRLRAVSPPGIEFLHAEVLAEGAPALGRVITQARYAVLLPAGLSAGAAELHWTTGAPLLAARRERSDSRRPDRGNPIDVRKSLTHARAATEDERRLLADKLAWSGGPDGVLSFGLVVSALGSARPVEVIEAFFGPGTVERCEIVRTGVGSSEGSDTGQNPT
jgi:hypothetical protein